jgi:hypothetical protein
MKPNFMSGLHAFTCVEQARCCFRLSHRIIVTNMLRSSDDCEYVCLCLLDQEYKFDGHEDLGEVQSMHKSVNRRLSPKTKVSAK